MPEYNGEAIAANRGVIVVNTNYRTNGESSNPCETTLIIFSLRLS
jgi:hypothetical protein